MGSPDLSAATWRKSTYSNGDGGDCVEVADNLPHVVGVRDSKDTDRGHFTPGRAAWAGFLRAIKD